MLDEIVPASVVVVERFADEPGVQLFAVEEEVIRPAVDKRRNEFATVRHCARLALAQLGIGSLPLVPGLRGAPVWPPGVVGSMTHCDGYRAAAIARSKDLRTLGIDAEQHLSLPPGVLDLVSRPVERHHLAALTATVPTVAWDRVLFSAKEAIYKAWFPLAREWLGFDEAEVSINPDDGTFEGVILRAAANGARLRRMSGRWTVAGELIATAVALPVRDGAG